MTDNELTVGVLGGMGPEATIDFMAEVLQLTDADRDQGHIHLIVDQNPKVPNRQQVIRSGHDDVSPALGAMATRLEQAGADFLVMPCNSAHAFERAIRAATSLPFVSIVDVCVQAIEQAFAAGGRAGRRVGLMATDGLVETGLYQRALKNAGLGLVLPDGRQQERLMALIHRIKGGDKGDDVGRGMSDLAESLVDRGADAVLAACTEIPLVLAAGDLRVPLVSSTEALARRTVALARGALRLGGQ
jgi:aspartate racemase